MKSNRRLLRIPQAVEYVNGVIKASTFRQWIWARKIETVRLGRAVSIPSDTLDQLIEAGRLPADAKSE